MLLDNPFQLRPDTHELLDSIYNTRGVVAPRLSSELGHQGSSPGRTSTQGP